MKLKTMAIMLGVAAALHLCGGNLLAQNANQGGPGGPPPDDKGPGGPGVRVRNIDPTQFQQRMMEQTRTNLSVTNDDEWSVIQPLIQKVMDARREVVVNGGGMVMRMGMGGLGGQGGPGGRGGFDLLTGDEQKALQKALDDKAPIAQVKDTLAKYRTARQKKQAELQVKLEAAQAHLKSVLTYQQEARAVLMGLLP